MYRHVYKCVYIYIYIYIYIYREREREKERERERENVYCKYMNGFNSTLLF